jgi:hypothetical protein
MLITRTDTLLEALDRFESYAYLDAPGFAFHGPMGAETLSTLGRDDLVAGWVERYKTRHQPLEAPPLTVRIDRNDAGDWRAALGDIARVSDWEAMFTTQLSEEPWPDVLRRWAPVLLPGYAGALTHGLIRVGHAVRSLPVDGPVPAAMLAELARGLALWAATFTTLPGRPALEGPLDLPTAIAGLPRPDPPWSIFEAGLFARIGELDAFPSAVAALTAPGNIDQALSELTAAFCRVLLANADVFPLPLVHMVTPIGALRTLLPYLDGVPLSTVYAHAWHVGAAITVGFTPATPPSHLPLEGGPPDVGAVVARAVEHGETHVLKFVEACSREYAITPDPVYLLAAARVSDRLTPWEHDRRDTKPHRIRPWSGTEPHRTITSKGGHVETRTRDCAFALPLFTAVLVLTSSGLGARVGLVLSFHVWRHLPRGRSPFCSLTSRRRRVCGRSTRARWWSLWLVMTS